jgi:general secretion pathway protein J
MQQRGFTLIEMLAAVAIFAVIGMVAYGSLDLLLKQRDDLQRHSDRFSQLQSAMMIIEQDIQQAVNRPVRSGYGEAQAAMELDSESRENGHLLLSLTRAGYPLPSPQQRSGLYRVAYRVSDGDLQRLVWPVLDQAQDTRPTVYVLLHDVRDITFRTVLRNTDSGSVVPRPQPRQTVQLLPDGIDMSIDIDGIGRIGRVIQVTG